MVDIMNNLTGILYFPIPNFNNGAFNSCSIVDALKSVGYPYDKNYRIKIGQINNIPGPILSPAYNMQMLNLMKQGKLIIP